MKRKVFSIKNFLTFTLLIILIYSFTSNKTDFSYGIDSNFNSIRLNTKYLLQPDRKDEYAFFFPIDLINSDKFLFYYSKLNTFNLNSGRIIPLISNSSPLAPWSLLGHSFENSQPGNFVILSENRIILPEMIENKNGEDGVSISAYEYNTGKLIWRTPLRALNLVGLEHRYKLNLTEQGILYTSIDPFLLYCLDPDTGKIKWIYNAENNFGNLSALYNMPASMAYWRSFQFFVEYFYCDGIVTYLSYSSKAESKSINKHVLISWNGKLTSELKYEPIGFIEDKYIFHKEDKNSSKYYIGLAKLIDSSVIWQREVPLPFSSSYPIENTYFLFNEREISPSEIPCKIITDNTIFLGGRNDKEDFMNCLSIKTGQTLWTYSLPKDSLRDIHPMREKIFVLSSLSDKKRDLITILSNKSGKILKSYPFNTGTSGEIFYVTEISENYLLFLRDCVIELSNNSDYVSVASYRKISEEPKLPCSELVPVVMENKNWIILSFIPDVRGGATGGWILSFSKDGNVPKIEDSSEDKQKEENNNNIIKEITKDDKKDSNNNEVERKSLRYLLPLFILVLLLSVIIIFIRRKGKYK